MKKNQTSSNNLVPKTSNFKRNLDKCVLTKFDKIRINKTVKNISTNAKEDLMKSDHTLLTNRNKKENLPLTTSRKDSTRKKIITGIQNDFISKINPSKTYSNIRQKVLNIKPASTNKSNFVNMTNNYSDMAKKLKMNKKSSLNDDSGAKVVSRNSTDQHSSINLISKTTVSAKNSHSNTERHKCYPSLTNCYGNLDFECPEDLHFFYVTMSQKNKVLAYKFEGEGMISINTINSINVLDNNIKVDEV